MSDQERTAFLEAVLSTSRGRSETGVSGGRLPGRSANQRVDLAGYGYTDPYGRRQPLLDSQERLASASIVARQTPGRNRGSRRFASEQA